VYRAGRSPRTAIYFMRFREADLGRMIRIFLSSGDDAAGLRDRVEKLVNEAINPPLREAGSDIRLEVDRWEVTPAQRTRGDATNEQFVERARQAHLTLALLIDRLGQGTRDEIEAVLEAEEEISALWFIARNEHPDSEVARFLEDHKEDLYHDKTGRPDSDDSWVGITRVLMTAVLTGLQQPRGAYVERR
jgi:hypothetical protein